MKDPSEEGRLINALVQYDQTLAESGSSACTVDQAADLSTEANTRFQRARQCLDFLATLWPRENSRLADDGRPSACAAPATALAAADVPLGDFGRFRLLKVLSEGGMGVVYKAVHVALDQVVAIKIISPHLVADPHAVARFHREMAATGIVDHPNLLHALDADQFEGKHFLVLEYVDGRNLAVVVRTRGPLAASDACDITRQAALGLAHAHRLGLVHRDVKPANVMLDRNGGVKVLDLGLALLRKELLDRVSLTEGGQVMGTVDFTAPEQTLDPHHVDGRSDIYALGCTLYYMLCGHAPFGEKEFNTSGKKMMAHATLPVRPIQQWRPDVDDALATVIERMLAKDPGERFATADAVAGALTPLARECHLTRLLDP